MPPSWQLHLRMPRRVHGLNAHILSPRGTWNDAASYDTAQAELVGLCANNPANFKANQGSPG